ncbi:MAG: putative glycosyltransferase [Solirubrobacterales bacterium]|nr:putative glycosyltransferase [Solirubrobacterales bacterium]
MARIAEQHRRPLDAAEYAGIVERTRAVVAAAVPPDAAVAVISRGDEALLLLGARRGSHFPRAASGAYAGHHPPDSAAAIAHLQELCTGGVRHLVVPATARWWLDHYEGFARHLEAQWTRIAEDGACTVFALELAAVAPEPAVAPDPRVDATTLERMRRFLDALLPDECHVLLAGHGWDSLELRGRGLRRLEGDAAAALAEVEEQRRAGDSAYLVVPLAATTGWLGELLAAVEQRQATLARRDALVAVFDLQAASTATHGRVPV